MYKDKEMLVDPELEIYGQPWQIVGGVVDRLQALVQSESLQDMSEMAYELHCHLQEVRQKNPELDYKRFKYSIRKALINGTFLEVMRAWQDKEEPLE